MDDIASQDRTVVNMDLVYGLDQNDTKKRVADTMAVIEEFGLIDDSVEGAIMMIKVVWKLLGEDHDRYQRWVSCYNDENPENSCPWPDVDPRLDGYQFESAIGKHIREHF